MRARARIGVALGGHWLSLDALRRIACLADARGVEALFVDGDDTRVTSRPEAPLYEPAALCATLLAHSAQLRVGAIRLPGFASASGVARSLATQQIVEFLNSDTAALGISSPVDVEQTPDGPRLNLSGVYVEGQEGTLRMVATDGHRLAMIDRAVAGKLPDKGVILPRKGLSEAKKILETPGSERSATMVTRLSSRFILRSPASDGCVRYRRAEAAVRR